MDFRKRFAIGGAAALLLANPVLASPADNKASAINAMTDLFSKQDPKGVDRYFTSPYHQHNTRIPDGLDALRALAQQATTWTGVHITVHRAIADGDLVVLQSVYWNLANRHDNAVAFDLFRFDKAGKIVEHWDALGPAASSDPSGRAEVDGETKITDLNKTEANRATAKAYIDGAFLKPDAKQASTMLASGFVDHSAFATEPKADVRYLTIHKTLAEGDLVFVQGEGRIGGDQILEIYDLFRLKAGKIVEHWGVHQPVAPPAQWANPNGPF